MDQSTEDHPRFVSIDYFVIDMLGLKARSNYYNHRNDEGWPQRVYPTGKPMLVYEECVAYQKMLMNRRGGPPPVKAKPVRTKTLGRPVA
jgi:hypothetical protein